MKNSFVRLCLLDNWAYLAMPYKCPNRYSLYKMFPWKDCENHIFQTLSRLKFLDITDKPDHQILHLYILHTIQCCLGNCKPQIVMFKWLQKSK